MNLQILHFSHVFFNILKSSQGYVFKISFNISKAHTFSKTIEAGTAPQTSDLSYLFSTFVFSFKLMVLIVFL